MNNITKKIALLSLLVLLASCGAKVAVDDKGGVEVDTPSVKVNVTEDGDVEVNSDETTVDVVDADEVDADEVDADEADTDEADTETGAVEPVSVSVDADGTVVIDDMIIETEGDVDMDIK